MAYTFAVGKWNHSIPNVINDFTERDTYHAPDSRIHPILESAMQVKTPCSMKVGEITIKMMNWCGCHEDFQ